MITRRYRILDLDLSLTSNSPSFLNQFDTDYARFSVTTSSGKRRLECTYTDKGRGMANLSISGAASMSVDFPDNPFSPYFLVIDRIMKSLDGFIVIHGGVVAKGNQALVICGPAGAGKTTLVLALLEQGFGFLSDEFCPFHHETGLVYPFPRTVWKRVNPTVQANPNKMTDSFQRMRIGKAPVASDGYSVLPLTQPCRVKSVIYLDPENVQDGWFVTRVQLSAEGEKELLRRKESLPEITVEKCAGQSPMWEVRYRKNRGYAAQAISLFEKLEPYTLNKYRLDSYAADFEREPLLKSVSSAEMAYLLLAEMKTEPVALRKSPERYFLKLAELLARADCRRLVPGRLEAMAKAALDVFA